MPKNKFNALWSEVAERDLISIIEYILKDNESNAKKIYDSIKKASLELNSLGRIIYRIEQKNVYILAVIDSRRNIEDILLKRFLI